MDRHIGPIRLWLSNEGLVTSVIRWIRVFSLNLREGNFLQTLVDKY